MNKETLQKARLYARLQFNILRAGELRNCHPSHAAARALELTDKRFDIGYGVEGDTADNGEGHITIQYINTGDAYTPTVCYYKGRFIVSSWGDIAERL